MNPWPAATSRLLPSSEDKRSHQNAYRPQTIRPERLPPHPCYVPFRL